MGLLATATRLSHLQTDRPTQPSDALFFSELDRPGCEIRAELTLSAAATVGVQLAQKHGSPPAGRPGRGRHCQPACTLSNVH